MFYFTEYFIKKSIRNGVSLMLMSLILYYVSNGQALHYLAMSFFIAAAFLWIFFAIKFKKQLDAIDEPVTNEEDSTIIKSLKFMDSILWKLLFLALIVKIARPDSPFQFVIVAGMSVLFLIRIYSIVIISNYLSNEVRN